MYKIIPKKPLKLLESTVAFLAAGIDGTFGIAFEGITWPVTYTISKIGPSDLRKTIKETEALKFKPHFKQVNEFYSYGKECLNEAYK